jgi:hypothetical protein
MAYAPKTTSPAASAGEHPLGEVLGAAAGLAVGVIAVAAAEGVILGSVAGLPGMAAGALIGGFAGALAGKEAGELINPNAEDMYWRQIYKTRPYVNALASYRDYEPAYHHGIKAFRTFSGRKFDEMEPYIAMEWETARGESHLNWETAKPAIRDAYERLYDRKSSKA